MHHFCCFFIFMCFIAKTGAEKKYCWYFEGGYPVYFICKTYEDCCDTQCCVRLFSIHRTWYFGLLLFIAIVFCCGAGHFIRRRVHTYTFTDGPDFNVTFTRHPIQSPGLRNVGCQNYRDAETTVISAPYPVQTHPGHSGAVYPVLPPYYSQPPPSYDQAIKDSQKK